MGLPQGEEAGGREGEKKLQSRWKRGFHRSQPPLLSDLWKGDQGHMYPNLPPARWPEEGLPSLSLHHPKQSQAWGEQPAGRVEAEYG